MSLPSYDSRIIAARAEALFASALQRSDEPSTLQIRQSITAALGVHGDRGCAALVAQAYGDHPEIAAARMRWARTAVTRAFGGVRPESPPGGAYATYRTCCAA